MATQQMMHNPFHSRRENGEGNKEDTVAVHGVIKRLGGGAECWILTCSDYLEGYLEISTLVT